VNVPVRVYFKMTCGVLRIFHFSHFTSKLPLLYQLFSFEKDAHGKYTICLKTVFSEMYATSVKYLFTWKSVWTGCNIETFNCCSPSYSTEIAPLLQKKARLLKQNSFITLCLTPSIAHDLLCLPLQTIFIVSVNCYITLWQYTNRPKI